jgi:hypothetical protein
MNKSFKKSCDDNGMVIKNRFWDDFVEPGTKLYITPRKCAALAPQRGESRSGAYDRINAFFGP